jgi:hypothetical protein
MEILHPDKIIGQRLCTSIPQTQRIAQILRIVHQGLLRSFQQIINIPKNFVTFQYQLLVVLSIPQHQGLVSVNYRI